MLFSFRSSEKEIEIDKECNNCSEKFNIICKNDLIWKEVLINYRYNPILKNEQNSITHWNGEYFFISGGYNFVFEPPALVYSK